MFYLRNEPYESHAFVPGGFAPHECAAIRQLFLNAQTGLVSNNKEIKTIRDSMISWLHYQPEHHWIFERISACVNEVNGKCFGLDLNHFESIQLTEYDASYQGFYGQHIDASYGGVGSGRSRKLSLTIQLTAPDEYEGGELRLYPINYNDYVVAPRDLGTITFFRSQIIHEVMPVTSGKRLSMVTWVHGPLLR